MTASDGQGGEQGAATQKDGTTQGDAAAEAPALVVIEAFGGIRPMAKTLGLAVSTVQGWKERSAIPANRHDQIRAAAQKHGITLDPAVLRASAPAEGSAAQPPVIEGRATPLPGADAAGEKAEDKATAKPEKTAAAAAAATTASAATKAAAKSEAREATTAPAARSGGGFLPGLAVGVVLAAAVAGATIYTQPYWAPLLGETRGAGDAEALAAALAEVDQRLAELQASLPRDNATELAALGERLAIAEAALSQGAGQDPETRAALESLSAQLARMTDRLEDLEQDLAAVRSLAGTPSQEVVSRLGSEAKRLDEMLAAQADLAARLAETEAGLSAAQAARDAAPGSREALMLLAMLQLRDALKGSGPYDQPLIMLKNLAAEDGELAGIIAPLERRATAGLPSLSELQARFPEASRRIAAIEVGQEGEGWSAGVLRRLSEAVNLRPVGMVEGGTPTAIAARAEVKLNQGDLAGALAELDALEGAAAEAVAGWRADAEARLAAEQAVGALGAQVSQRFAALAGG